MGQSCAHKHGILKKVSEGTVEAEDVKAYLACLKEGKKNMIPGVVQFITTAAKDKGVGEVVSSNCHEMIENEEDGCDQDYSPQMKGLLGVEAEITLGDLCVKACSKNDEEEKREHGGGGVHGGGGKHHSGDGTKQSCAQKHGILKKVSEGTVEAEDVNAYLACLKEGKKNMIPGVVQFITKAAKDKGVGEEVSSNCREMIENEEDGCDQDYSPQMKGLLGVEAEITLGDLCVKACSKNDEEEKREHGGGGVHGGGGKHHSGDRTKQSCAQKHGILKKVSEGTVEAEDVNAYLACLKEGKKNMIPGVVQFITKAAKDKGVGEEVSNNCHELIDNEEDGCDQDYSPQMKGLLGVEAEITLGDLCVKACSKNDEEEKREHGGGVEEKFQLFAAPLHTMSSTSVGTMAAAVAATGLAAAAFGARASRRGAPLLTDAGQQLVDETGLE